MRLLKKFKEIDEDDKKYPNVKGIWLEDDYLSVHYPYNSSWRVM